MNGLEALDYLLDKQEKLEKYGSSGTISVSKQRECLNAIEKELKAFEIIKRTALRLVSLEDETTICPKGKHAFYDGELYQYEELTKDEFDLLKEVLL
jgi:hypothetical protein